MIQIKLKDGSCNLHVGDTKVTRRFKEKYSVEDVFEVTEDMNLSEVQSDLFELLRGNAVADKEIIWNFLVCLIHNMRTC